MWVLARRLFDGTGTAVHEDWAVEVHGQRIVSVGPRSRDIPGRGAEVLDLGDVTLLPGLVDAHQHLVLDASTDPVAHLGERDDAALLLAMDLSAQRALAVGITTIRDLGDRGYLSLVLRDRYRDGGTTGPRLLVAGPPITTTRGHCWFLGGEADGVDGVRAAVRQRAVRGVDVVKVMATGGNLTPTRGPHESQYGRAELTAAVDEAHAHGLPVAVHAHGPEGIADALAAGADSIEHCTFFTADGVEAPAGALEELARSGVTISMTGAVLPDVAAPYPAMRQRLAAIMDNFAALHRAGARIVCSSDAGVVVTKPHDVLPHGVSRALPAIGMTAAEALVAVTSRAAETCGLSEVTGTIAPGKDADLLAVAGNPLEDPAAIHDVVAVLARGVRCR